MPVLIEENKMVSLKEHESETKQHGTRDIWHSANIFTQYYPDSDHLYLAVAIK